MSPFASSLLVAAIWGLAIPFSASFLSVGAGSWLASLPARRRLSQGSHWSEIARAWWPARVAGNLMLVWILALAYFSYTDSGPAMCALTAASAFAGCLAGSRVAALGMKLPEGARPARLATLPARWLLNPAMPSILIVTVLTCRRGFDHETFLIAGCVLLLNVALVTGGSMMILKSLRILRPADPDLQQLARGLAETQDAPLRSVLQMDLGSANAFAATWTHELILTDAAVTALDRSELGSVISHEMGHLKESRLTCWKRMVALPGIVAIGLAPAAIVDGKPLVAIGLFAGFFIVIRLASRNHKRLEVAADLHAHHSQAEDGVYARALEKIHAASLIPAVFNARHPYPNLFDRMTDAGVLPDFPRPAAPDRVISFVLAAAAAACFFYLLGWFGEIAGDWLAALWPKNESSGAP